MPGSSEYGPGDHDPGHLWSGNHSALFGAALEDEMAYKGDDLDLRAPQGRAAAGQTVSGFASSESEGVSTPGTMRARARSNGQYQNGAQRSPALYVDETLLACCNHAYDIASANGAREVLLEHLVHALTRVPEAAQILENRGVHVMALRRESAAIIANDLPISPSDSGSQVRASSDFDAVLHLAAANARLRSDRPTSVRDVLFVLMNYDRQASGIDLLRRHWASWQQDDMSERDEPVRTASPLQRDPRIEVRHQVYEPAPVIDRVVERIEAPARMDRLTEARIEALVNSLHDSAASQRADMQSLRAALGDRLHRLEKAIEHGRHDGANSAIEMAITARLQRLEKMQESILAQRVNLGPLEASINERLHRLEKMMEANRLEHGKLPAGMNDRLHAMERMLETRLTDMQRAVGQSGGQFNEQLGERLQKLDKSIESVTHAMPSGLIDRMQAMEGSFEGKITESMRTWGSIGERLQGLERSLQAHRAEVAHLQSNGAQLQAVLNERAQAMERAIENWRQEAAAAATRLPGPIIERLGALENTLSLWRDEGGTTASGEVPGVLFERLQSLERTVMNVRDDGVRVAQMNESAIADLRSGVTRLSGVQQGLSAAIDQWRLDNTGDLGIISNRLEAIEHSSVRPMELLESLNARIQAMGMGLGVQAQNASAPMGKTSPATMQTTRVRVGQRRGFWRWLFGLS